MSTFGPVKMACLSLAVLAFGFPAFATALVQCNKQIDGAFVPVLIVEQGNKSTTYRIGDRGLTRSMIFSQSKAKAWAKATLGINATNYYACGFPDSNDRSRR